VNRLDDDDDDMIRRGTGFDRDGSGLPPGTAAVSDFLEDLQALGTQRPPEPPAELATLLVGVTPLGAARRRLTHSRAVIAGAAAIAVLGTTGVAAANDSLPQPAQRMVSNVVNLLTPFHIDPPSPRPAPNRPEIPIAPAVTPSPTPINGSDDTSEESAGGSDDSSAPDRDPGGGPTVEGAGDESGAPNGSGTRRSNSDDAASDELTAPAGGAADSSPDREQADH
jgi:hypothetical protein